MPCFTFRCLQGKLADLEPLPLSHGGMATIDEQVKNALHYILARLPVELQSPVIGIVCGSGLNGLVEIVMQEPRLSFNYGEIPHFQPSTGRVSVFDGVSDWSER